MLDTKENFLFSTKNLPLFQNCVYETKQDALNCKTGEINLVQNAETGLIYNSKFENDLMVYDEFYENEQSYSKIFQNHLFEVLKLIQMNFEKKNIIEVGCGSGFFLELLNNNGLEVVGFDPAYKGTNPKIQKSYFNIKSKNSANGLILRHVLEHINDPYTFLLNLKKSNDGGLVYIEVPCFDWILDKRTWFDIFYEHVNYFRLEDLKSFFGRILDCGKLFSDQYIYIIADLNTLRKPRLTTKLIDFPRNFFRYNINSFSNIIWGGSSKGVIYSIYRQNIGYPIKYVIDINPKKQGYYLPVTGLRVISPDNALNLFEKDSKINIMNSNYIDEVNIITKNKFTLIGIDQ